MVNDFFDNEMSEMPELLEENFLDQDFNELIHSRNELINNTFNRFIEYSNDREIFVFIEQQIPETFWEPVIVKFQDIDKLETLVLQEPVECIICTNLECQFKKVACCNNKICKNCINIWFNKSVFCPFCKCDQREILI